MSAQEIIAELPKLKPEEFRLVQAKVEDLAKTKRRTIGEVLLDFAGTAEGLPRDMARNHDHDLRAERIAGRLILAGPRVVRQAEVEAILDEFP
jgi:SHS2 domain-containing protein